MNFEDQIALDMKSILNDSVNGFAEPVYFRTVSREGYAVFLDSWEEEETPFFNWMLIDIETFNNFDLDHGHLIYRQQGEDRQTFEIRGFQPAETGDHVACKLGPTNALFTLPA